MKKKVLIIGAGVIGLHCAYYLNERGCEVEVIDANEREDESGCSYGNCGLIVPSHFLPMASPAMLQQGLKLMFDRTSPVYLPLARNIKNASWFFRFIQAANKNKVNQGIPILYQLNAESHKLYKELNKISRQQSNYHHKGLLMMATTQKGLDEEGHLSEKAQSLGIKTQMMSASEVVALEPNVKVDIKGAVFYDSDGNVSPEHHMRWLKSWLEEAGVIFHYGTKTEKIIVNKGKIDGVQTRSKKYKADDYILATGVQTSALVRSLGISLPIIAGKGYSIDLPSAELPLKIPAILSEAKVAITPLGNKVRLGSGMEFGGRVGELRMQRIQSMLNQTCAAIPSIKPKVAKEQVVWEGLRPLSPTGIPYIGGFKSYKNLFVASGHAMMGMSLAPITGKLISQHVMGEKPMIDLGAY
ncbi:NAD(P)/FAD-dependent oxidoreductase [Carboxylicivirga linearis]|uniref:FAD-dependent oxidoreductase n=1 Tax=Carboxylicivirga linearis TaxID=1628157 RepID=A0ABS5JQE2_9BACT|nr:FAD-dependent oxidoreductase [Carboxylicivirga linearis]MBS2097087.1 FAD-dependent oxidoreductase [Carboxylicivirga linearis]